MTSEDCLLSYQTHGTAEVQFNPHGTDTLLYLVM